MMKIEPEDRANAASEAGLHVKAGPNKYDPAIGVILGGWNVGSLVPRGDFVSDCGNETHTKRLNVKVKGCALLRSSSRLPGWA